MTARCDLEHGKHSAVNFLPIIPFKAWVENDLCLLLAKDIKKKLSVSIPNVLKNKGAEDFVLKTFPLDEIARKLLTGKDLSRVMNDYDNLILAERFLKNRLVEGENLREIIKAAKGDCDSMVTHLVTQKLSEYYFLESIDISGRGNAEGWVVLLRHMRTISPKTMSLISKGLKKEDIDPVVAAVDGIGFDHDDSCFVTGVLRSPDIEHLAQSFSSLFTRIGLMDQDANTVSFHVDLTKSYN